MIAVKKTHNSLIFRHFNSLLWVAVTVFLLVKAYAFPTVAPINADPPSKPADRFNAELQRRYLDAGWPDTIRTMSPAQSRVCLREITRTIQKHYYRPIDFKKVIPDTLSQLVLVLKNESIIKQYGVNSDSAKSLIQCIETLQIPDFAHHQDSQLLIDYLANLSDSIQKYCPQTNVPSAWPDLELAASFVTALDPYSYLLTPTQSQRLYQQIDGQYRGIGVDLIYDGPYPTVFDVVQGSPASKVGIQPGDVLTQLADNNLQNFSADQVTSLFSKHNNSPIELTLKRNDQLFSRTVSADVIDSPSVRHAGLVSSDGVGYLRVCAFDQDTVTQIRRVLVSLSNQKIKSLIIDLRDNGGGIFNSALEMAKLFIREGNLIETISKNNTTLFKSNGYDYGYFDLPIVILVNKNTASAAEIFALTLQNHHRATIIGQKTFGKALVQTIISIPTLKLSLSVTTSKWAIAGIPDDNFSGIIPDIIIDQTDHNAIDRSINSQLSADNLAIQTAIEQLKSHS